MNFINNSFQALLVQLGPKECLLPQHDSTADAAKVREVIQRSNILISERKKGKFSNIARVTYQIPVLGKILLCCLSAPRTFGTVMWTMIPT